jgi:hypothetical protein
LRASFNTLWAAIAAAGGATVRKNVAVVTSRIAYMTYWAGVARGAKDGIVRGTTVKGAPSL